MTPSSSSSTHPYPSLRVDTDPQHLNSRLRSKSTTQAGSRDSATYLNHQVSRSFSHVSPNSASPASASRDVVAAVSILRGRSDVEGGEVGGALGWTMQRIHEALERSGDEGDTLDLSRRGIEEIDAEAVEMFRKGVGSDHKGVWRLALSYNSLRDGSIAPTFARLSRLRYLNLKGNNLSQFPPALIELVALEILDLSKNQIDAFPETPGRLAYLKVLSITDNRLYTLPAYLTTFDLLKVFKVDGNPIEWPPREVLGALIDNDSTSKRTSDAASLASTKSKRDEDLRPSIENMKNWMRQKAADTDRLLARSRNEEAYMTSEEEPSSAILTDGPSSATSWSQQSLPLLAVPSSLQTIRPLREDRTPQPGSPAVRPKLDLRGRSTTVSAGSLERPVSPGLYFHSRSTSRHDRSASTSSFTTPPASTSTASSAHSRTPSQNLLIPSTPLTGHSRGASYSATQRLSANLTAKKSLPDLRLSHAKIIQDRRDSGQEFEEIRPLGLGINAPGSSLQSKNNVWAAETVTTPTASPNRARGTSRKGSLEMLRKMKTGMGFDLAEGRGSQEGPLVDESRNSYFRRLSTLPASSISKAIPSSLLQFVDAIRGILYALSQLHAALRQYLLFAVHESIAGVFARVMDPADTYMNNLINALDRFDSMSRRHTPPVHVIRSVIDAVKESIAVFAKIVAVLRLQIPALRGSDERYSRTLLLMIYGSMAEIASSWKNMAPLLTDIKCFLAVDGQGVVARALIGGHKMFQTSSLTGRTPISPIPERGESHSPPSVPRPTVPVVGSSPLNQKQDDSPAPQPTSMAGGRSRSRRQGGSFSTQDIERGMHMGSPSGPRNEELSCSYLRHRPSGSAPSVLEEQSEEAEAGEETLTFVPTFPGKAMISNSTPMIPITPPELAQPAQPVTMVSSSSQGPRRGHGAQSSSGSSHALSMSNGLPPVRKLSVDVRPPTPASATLFDEDLLDAIETAIDIAFTVWLRLAEDMGASSPPFRSHAKYSSQSSDSSHVDSARTAPPPLTHIDNSRRPATISAKDDVEMLQLLSQAEQITTTLRESTLGLRADPHTYPHTTLPDDAQAFIKIVVKVSELVKVISATHSFPPVVRQSCSRLTQATRECAILIQVSSLRPDSSNPAPIPPASARPPSLAHHYSNISNGGLNSSSEDLGPPSASYQNPSAAWGQPPREGLRGLRLPSRQKALGRSRSPNAYPLDPNWSMGSAGLQSEAEGYFSPISARGGTSTRSAQASPAGV